MRNVGRGNNVNLMSQVVEGEQPVEEHQRAVGELKIVLGAVANVFKLANNVVRAEANCSGGEWRQSRHNGGFMLLQQFFRGLKDVLLVGFTLLPSLNHNFSAVRPQLHVGARPQKCVPPNLLPALN